MLETTSRCGKGARAHIHAFEVDSSKLLQPRYSHGQRWFAGLARLVARQPFDALRHESGLPPPNRGLGFARAAHDLGELATT